MIVKTIRKRLRLVLVLVILPITPNLWSEVPGSRRGDAPAMAQVTISVYNDAEVPADVLGEAEEQAEDVFEQAGIDVTWLSCRMPVVSEEASRLCREAVFPEHLHLRIVRKSAGLKGEAMGISFQGEDGSGCYADLFYEPMKQLHKTDGTNIANLLGLAAAHEIGHLLLGRNSHSAVGIMHAHWTAKELADARVAALVFSKQESQRMRTKLAAAMEVAKPRKLARADPVLTHGD